MKKTFTTLFLIAVSTWVLAGPGHDHGPEETGQAQGEASPRVVMQSDLFEAVGVVKDHTLQLFVDHTNSNAPVENATLDLELNGSKATVEQRADGEFHTQLPDAISEENVTVALTITAGDNIDILAGDLNLAHTHEEEPSKQHGHFSTTLLFSAAIIVLIALITWFAKRRSNKGAI